MIRILLIFTVALLLSQSIHGQNCGLVNPSFETYSTCPTNHSQIDVVNSWVKTLPIAVSTPDYYNYSCGFVDFTAAAGITVQAASENVYTNCGRVGLFLNYNDGIQSDRYKEFIGQDVDLNAGVQYTIELDVHKSNHTSTDDLERDLVVYGYNGLIPATHSNYCITGATPLATIPSGTITSAAMQTYSLTFTPGINYSHLLIGAECTGVGAVNTGYVFIDRVDLTSSDDNTLNPIITNYAYASDEECKCNFKAEKPSFYLKGTAAPTGATIAWGQNPSNPEVVTFTNSTGDSTGITGTGYLATGSYQFTYSFTKGGCTITDTINIEVIPPTLVSIDAGVDISVCTGNNDTGPGTSYRRVYMSASPSVADINTNNYHTWWSMIRDDGSEWVFPNPCGIPYDGTDEGDVYVPFYTGSISPLNCGNISSVWESSPTTQFFFRNPQDTVMFIWHVIDPCADTLVDTMMVYMNDIDLGSNTSRSLCPTVNDTILIQQFPASTIRRLRDNPNLSFTWSVTGGPVDFLDTATQIDSVRLVVSGAVSGSYDIRIDVTDLTSGCSWHDTKRVSITSIAVPTVDAGTDISVCTGNNDLGPGTSYRRITMNASPSVAQINASDYSTWWSMIRDDGTEWVFTNPCGIPSDGRDEGDVYTSFFPGSTNILNCGNISSFWESSPTAQFYFRNAQDTVMFIWHVIDPCSDTVLDTVMVYMNDIDLGPIMTQALCPVGNDTILIEQFQTSSLRRLRDNPNLSFTWSVSGGVPIDFLDTATKIDSVRLVVSTAVSATYNVRIDVTDLTSGCSWHDIKRIHINSIPAATIDAGVDQTICNTVLSNFLITMNASPTVAQINTNDYKSWWSVIRDDGSEWVFPNPCGIPYDGPNEGDVYVSIYPGYTNPPNCGNISNNWASAPNARFYLNVWRRYTFIWHIVDPCNVNDTLIDTVYINWGYDEPTVDAGPDQTPALMCNAIELQGNLSSASAGNTGCYLWRQISGPGTLRLIDSTNNLAYVVGMDTATPGVYELEYNLGCDLCVKTDTMTLTINPGISSGILDVTTSGGGGAICQNDSVHITGTLAYSYAFYVEDTIAQPFSLDSTFSIEASLDTTEILVLARNFAGTCFNSSDTALSFVAEPCLTTDTVTDCTGSYCLDTSELILGYDTLKTCSGTLSTSQGGSITINDTCVTHIPPVGAWLFDTICLTLCDTINSYCDTTLLIFCNTDLTVYCNDTNIYLNGLGVANIDTSFVLDSIISINYAVDSVWLSKNMISCANLPMDSVRVYARNTFGTVDSCMAYFTVADTTSPQITCQNPTIYLNGAGTVVIDTSVLISSFSDNCLVDSVWTNLVSSTLTCVSAGSNSVTVYIQDASGNIDSCFSNVTVLDTINPLIVCASPTVYLNGSGSLVIDTTGLITSFSDNCGVDSIWLNSSQSNLSCSDTGIYLATVYIRDVNGNIDSCISNLTVVDSTAPSVVCMDTTVSIGGGGNIVIDTSFLIQSVSDGCGVDTAWLSQTIFTCTDTGIHTVMVYVQDHSGNIDSCSSTLTVVNNMAPTLVCTDTTIYLDGTGNVQLQISEVLVSVVSNCGIDSIWLSDSLYNCTDIGLNGVWVYVRDGSLNIDSCFSNVIVLDTINPLIVCANSTLYLDGSGSLVIDTTGLITSYSDNCGIDSVWLSSQDTLLSCTDTGTYLATVYIQDVNGNLDSCISNLTVVDSTAPSIVCMDTTVSIGGGGNVVIDTSFLIQSVSDGCGVDTAWLSRTTFACIDTGVHIVMVYVQDHSGNIDSCSSNVTVMNTITPTLVCTDTTIYLDGTGNVQLQISEVLISAGSNCGVDSVWLSDSLYNCTDIGLNGVWVYVRDGSLNIDSCFSNVIVLDTINPLIVCASPTVYLNGSGSLVIDTTGLITSFSDNCGVDSVWLNSSQSNLSCSDTGIYLATVYIRDINGNIDSCISNLTVVDSTAPSIICMDTTVSIGGGGNVVIDTSFVIQSVGDGCGVDTAWLSQTTFTCTDTGIHTVMVYVRDHSGNIDSCSSNVTVVNNATPTLVCTDTTIYLDVTGNVQLQISEVLVSAGSNCGIDSVWLSDSLYNCTDIGLNGVWVYVRDGSLNIDSCFSNVIVLDTINPLIVCASPTVYLNGSGSLVIDTTGLITSFSDNCGVDSVWLNSSQSNLSCSDTGIYLATVYVRDINGNIDSCISNLTVVDSTAPSIVCMDTTVSIGGGGNVVIDTSFVIQSIGDGCGVDTAWLSQTTFTCIDTGIHTVMVYVRDHSGNIDSCSSNVTVVNTITPTLVCTDTTIYLDGTGNVQLQISEVLVSAGSNCGVDSIWLSDSLYNCTDIGLNGVWVYVRDGSLNLDSCFSNVTVLDTINPVLVCNSANLYLNGTGSIVIDTTGLITSFSDNCGVDSIWLSSQDTSLSCSDTGMYTVTIYIRDVSGNIDSCQSILTILDTISPSISCNGGIPVSLGPSGSLIIDTTGLISFVSDNCGVDSVWLNTSQTTVTCSQVGIVNVSLYAMDYSGNIDSCISSLTVSDNLPPSITCSAHTVYLNVLGQIVIDTTGLVGSTSDNCGVDSVWLRNSDTLLSCADTGGTRTVRVYVRDVNGNMDSCDAVLTVLDTINPTLVCQSNTIYLDSTGIISIDTTGLITSYSDNCGVDSVWLSPSDTLLSCLDTGWRSVTIYVLDNSNNLDSCVSNIHIRDTNLPVALCRDTTIYLDASGQYTIGVNYIDNGSYGVCVGIGQYLLSQSTYTCSDIGLNTVTLTVTDQNGRSSQCNSTVTVIDSIAPIISCPNDTSISLSGTCDFVVPDYTRNLIYSDNCGSLGVVVTQLPLAGTVIAIDSLGLLNMQQVVRLTATDSYSNWDTCSLVLDLSCLLNLEIPQFISPNGDGQNDTWEIIGINNYPGNSVKIFNRWGQMLFMMEDYDNSWSGQVNQGMKINMEASDSRVPTSTYFWIVDKNDGSDPIVGYLQLMK